MVNVSLFIPCTVSEVYRPSEYLLIYCHVTYAVIVVRVLRWFRVSSLRRGLLGESIRAVLGPSVGSEEGVRCVELSEVQEK